MHERVSHRSRRTSVGTGTVALSLGLCLCAGQLVSTSAASAATPVVNAAQAAAVKPVLLSSVNTSTVNQGSTVRVTARQIDPRTHKKLQSGKVRLQYYVGGKWRTYSVKSNNSAGLVRFYVKPARTTLYRTQYSGAKNIKSGATKSIKVTVRVQNKGQKILTEAKRHTGALYLFAASGPNRFDCSGFTKYVYKKAAGKSLPHKANSQQKYGTAVSKSNARVGDLVIFRSGSYGYHAGIYAGGGYMYDSPHSGARVGKHKMYGSNYVVRRIA